MFFANHGYVRAARRSGLDARLMTALPNSVRYVKNGAGGRWWTAAKAKGQIHASWKSVPDEALRARDLRLKIFPHRLLIACKMIPAMIGNHRG
jgi:hypothetical protein